MFSRTDHPGRAFQRRLRSIFIDARPPLLSQEGNALFPMLCTFPAIKKRGRVSESGLSNGLRIDCWRVLLCKGLDLAGFADQDEDEIVLREILLDDSARIGHCH